MPAKGNEHRRVEHDIASRPCHIVGSALPCVVNSVLILSAGRFRKEMTSGLALKDEQHISGLAGRAFGGPAQS